MSEPSISDARACLAAVVDQVRVRREPVFLTRRGLRVAAIVDADQLDELVAAAEDLADIRAAAAVRAQMAASGSRAVCWDEVKADLGLL